jgi:hypothetical protein
MVVLVLQMKVCIYLSIYLSINLSIYTSNLSINYLSVYVSTDTSVIPFEVFDKEHFQDDDRYMYEPFIY